MWIETFLSKLRFGGLRLRLVCLLLVGLLPAIVALGYLLKATYLEKQEQVSIRLLERTRTLSLGMDKELDEISAALQALATSPAIDSGDYASFHVQLRMMRSRYPGVDIILADPTGQQLVNSYMPYGSPLPKRNVPDRLQHLFETGKTSISGLYTGAISGRRFVSVDVPVIRNGRVILELGAALPVDQLLQTLALPKLPPEWTATILDSNNMVVARTQNQEEFLGKQAEMPVLAEQRKVAPEGTLEAIGLAGIPVLVGYSQSTTSGWTMVLSVSKAYAVSGLMQWLSWTIAGVVALGLLGISLALLIGNQIMRSIQALIAPAMALGRGEPVDIGRLELTEAQGLAESLTEASTLLRQREEELRGSEERYRLVVETASEGIWILDKNKVTTYVNSAIVDMLGYTLEEIIGRPGADFLFPEDLDDYAAHWNIRQSKAVSQYERRLRKKDGNEAWFIASTAPLIGKDGEFLGSFAMFTDITDRKHSANLLAQERQRLAHILEGTNVGTWEWNVQTGETVFNERWAQIIGYSLEELAPVSIDTWASLAHPEELKRSGELLERHFSGELDYYDVECRMKHKDSSWVWVHDRGKVATWTDDGKPLVMFGTHLDITERKRAEELRNQIERTVQHDLRTPASSAIYLAAMLRKDTNLTDEQRKLLGLFEYSGRSMLDTLNSTLDLFKIESHQYVFEPEQLDALDLIHGLRDLLQLSGKHADNKLRITLNGNHPATDAKCFCHGQANLTRVVLQNLILNALEASPHDGTVSVELSADKDCHIKIQNKGAVPAEIRERFFDKYVTRGKNSGTGLGTYSAKMMVTAMGGDITMSTSDADNETTVTVRMPC